MSICLRRRKFIAALGSTAAAWPLSEMREAEHRPAAHEQGADWRWRQRRRGQYPALIQGGPHVRSGMLCCTIQSRAAKVACRKVPAVNVQQGIIGCNSS